MSETSNICPEVNEVLTQALNNSYDMFTNEDQMSNKTVDDDEIILENIHDQYYSDISDAEDTENGVIPEMSDSVDEQYYSDITDVEDDENHEDQEDDIIWIKSIIRLPDKTIINYPTKHKEIQINFIKQ